MDCPPYIIDIALLLSATVTCLTGVFCGWKIRESVARRKPVDQKTPAPRADVAGFLETRKPLRTTFALDTGITAEDVLDATDSLSQIVKQLNADEATLPIDASFDELPSSESILFALGQMAMDKEMLEAQLRAAEIRIDEQSRQLETFELYAMTDVLTKVGNCHAPSSR